MQPTWEFGVPGIFDNVRDGLILVRFPAREIVLFNRAASELFGRPIVEALGTKVDDLFEDTNAVVRAIASASEPVGAWPGHEQELLLATTKTAGASSEVEVHFCRIDDVAPGGPLVLLVARPGPMTQMQAIAEQGMHAQRRVTDLERAARESALFFGLAAHEFNTPLTVCLLQIKLLQSALGELSPPQAKAVGQVEHNVRRLTLLAQDLLDAARADSGRIIVVRKAVAFGELAAQEVANLRPVAKAKGVVLDMTRCDGGDVAGDPMRLRQVLTNLLTNAVKFSDAGGHVRIAVSTDAGRDIRLSVQDDGCGIRPEDMGILFQPFARIQCDDVPTKPGTGLGLYLAKRIVEALGGRIGAQSEGSRRGTEFWVTLPLLTTSPVAESHEAAPRRPRTERPQTRSERPQRPQGLEAHPERSLAAAEVTATQVHGRGADRSTA